jgi:hypothetical protein
MGNKVLSIFSLFSVFILSSCLVQSPQDLITYDDGIYSWNPYPVSNISYINGNYRNFENLSTDYFDAYDEGFFDGSMNSFGTGYSYGNQYIVRGPIRRNWYFNRNSYYPAYFNGFNSPWNHSYNYSFGFNNPWGNPYSYGYGFNNPWGNPYSYGHGFNNFWGDPYSYGYGFNNPWGNRYWGNRYNCFSCGNWGWDNSNGDVISDSGPNLDLPDPNSSQRKLDLNGSTPIRRPSISNKLNGGEIQKTANDKISEKRIKSSGESNFGRPSNSISLKGSAKLYRTGNRKDYNFPTNSKIRNVKESTIQYKPGRASKIAGSSNTRSSNTRSSNTRSSNTRSSNTRSSNTRSSNTRSSNTRSSNTRSPSNSARNSKGGGR